MRTATCKLCGTEGQLQHSHVLPEFMYRPTYDETHTFVTVSRDPDVPVRKVQKGYRQHLLCRGCEQRFCAYEQKVSGLIKTINDSPAAVATSVVVDYDYRALKLFGLSILWRAHLSTLPLFADMDLGSHAAPIHQMLVDEDPGEPLKYGFFLCRLIGSTISTRTVMPFTPLDRSGDREVQIYVMASLGIYWVFSVMEKTPDVMGSMYPFVGTEPRLAVPVLPGRNLIDVDVARLARTRRNSAPS